LATVLKAIHAQEDREAAEKKAADVVTKLAGTKLPKAVKIVEEGVGETLSYMQFPREHWTRIRTNNPLERIDFVRTDCPATSFTITIVTYIR
jgi:putative transposase